MKDRNIFGLIAEMRKGMKAVGYTKEEIEKATQDVKSSESYEEAKKVIKKYWK